MCVLYLPGYHVMLPLPFFYSQFTMLHSLADKVSYNGADLILLVTGKQFDPLLFSNPQVPNTNGKILFCAFNSYPYSYSL